MTPFNVINDTHCGVVRSAGTTPATAFALRRYVLDSFRNLLTSIDGDLLILGDLFDTANVPYIDLLEVYWALCEWMDEHPDSELILPPGNHDLAKTTTTMSSFQFLCKLLSSNSQVTVMNDAGPADVAGNPGWIIPHVPNQDLFDLELSRVPEGIKYLFVHCNYDNKFAQQMDNSLNMSAEQAAALKVERIIFAHEHQRKEAQNGKVVIIGNQIPSSVSDCLGNDAKYMLRITDKLLEHIPVWDRKGSFVQVDWRETMTSDPAAQFIRVAGEASTLEAAAVVSAVSKLRNAHGAFVVTNAVKIEGRDSTGEKISLEQAESFDILAALMKRLKPEQAAVVKRLMEEDSGTAG